MSELVDMTLAYLAVLTACALVLSLVSGLVRLYEVYKLWAEKKGS